MNEIRQDLKEIKEAVHSLDKQLAINTLVLDEHHKRSTMLEERFKPIEKHIALVAAATKIVLGLGSFCGVVYSIIKLGQLVAQLL